MPMARGRVMREAQWGLRTIRAALMAGVCLGAVNAHAVDGTWLPAPATSDWNTGTNWTSGAVPDGTATFNTSSQTSITFSSSTFIQRIQFTSTASTFSFALPSTGLGITGAGISISSPDFTPAPTFTVSGDGLLAFANSATASDRPSFPTLTIPGRSSLTTSRAGRSLTTAAPPDVRLSLTTTIPLA